ncbi:MAG: hypothetical protein QOE08_1502 [Thermoleophilaceae bacterium]|nr:hypothetical protein [Thermoleophilaceae bacterium]
MAGERPVLLFDLGSPYAWLSAERIAPLGDAVEWRPILLGGVFKRVGRHSWAETEERERGMAEVERRAAVYRLPPVRWPPNWPNNGLAVMRAAWVAKRHGREREFALAGFRMAFTEGIDLSEPEAVRELCEREGIDLDGIASPAIKTALKEASDDAVERGVIGVPTLLFGGEPVWGDDRLDEALTAAGLALSG